MNCAAIIEYAVYSHDWQILLKYRKTYKYKHRFSSTPAKTDEMLMSSQETVSQDIPSAHKVLSQKKLVQPDPNPDADFEEAEPGEWIFL